MEELRSSVDDSVNFVMPATDGGYWECRYVRREPDYFICYLSSHSGCNRGCRFCHLTTTGQTTMMDARGGLFLKQADLVLKHYQTQAPAKYVHFNWMARGEPLCNRTILEDSAGLLGSLGMVAMEHGLIPKFNISTIMPTTLKKPLDEIFRITHPTIYYSIYSIKEAFREKWLPGAMPVKQALEMLVDFQRSTKKIVKLHWCFIEGENDDVVELQQMLELINSVGLRAEFNVVRYNPYSPQYGRESPNLPLLESVLKMQTKGSPVQTVPRVGPDVFASCGMFFDRPEL